MPRPLLRDLLAMAFSVLLVAGLSALMAGDAALLVLLGVAGAMSCLRHREWQRRAALAFAVLMAGAIPAFLAHWVFHDHEPLGLLYQPTKTAMEGAAGLTMAVMGLTFTNRRQPGPR